MKREDYKKELLEHIYNGEPKEFKIEKVTLSDDHPIIQEAREWTRKLTPEELEEARKSMRYPGLSADMRVRRRPQRTFFGIQIRIGWWQ